MHARSTRVAYDDCLNDTDWSPAQLQDLSFLCDDVADVRGVMALAPPQPSRRDQIVECAFAQLRVLAGKPARFFGRFCPSATVCGQAIRHDRAIVEQVRLAIIAGDRTWMPTVAFAGARQLAGAQGAYAAATGTVYVSTLVPSIRRAADVLLEAIGHHIIARGDHSRWR